MASHELRTPVTSLLLSVQLLQEGAVGELTPDQQEVIGAQREDLERLERMMRDLLDITRLEAGVTPPRFEIAAASELVTAAIGAIDSQAQSKGILLTSDAANDLPSVRADRSQINRVLVNLLNNAIRHTPKRRAGYRRCEVGGGRRSIYGTRYGHGHSSRLSAAYLRAVRAGSGRDAGRRGPGLSIVKTIIEAHHAQIRAESELGKGSAFIFTLPTTAS